MGKFANMSGNRIEQYDLIAKEALGTIDDAKAKLLSTVETMKLLAQEGVKFNQSFKNPKGLEDTVKGTKKVNDNTNKLVQTSKALAKQQEILVKSEAKRIASMSKTNKEIVKSRLETQKNNKEIRQQIQLNEAEKGSLNRLEKELADNINKYRNLTAAKRDNQAVGGKLLKDIQKQDAAVKKLNSTLGRAQGNVGNYKSALAGVGKQMVGALGIVGGVTAFVSVMKNATKVVVDFSAAQSELQALSGKTKDQLAGLTEQALLLGSSTEFTATQATNAQIELVKLGLSTEQIESSTPEILKFASATGAELPAAAKTAAVAMRSFGLEASQMGDITSALAVATTKSALSFQDYDTILSTLGPVAKAYGFSLEETIDLTSQLKNAGFDASSAATATRNIMLNLADTNGDLAKSLGHPINNIEDLGAGLLELKNKGVDLGEALQLTDKRSVAAFSTFLEGAGSLGELKDSITGANEELDVMVEKRLDNLRGDTVKLSSAWEGFLLSIESGDGIFSKISRTIVQFLTKILGGLTKLAAHKKTIGILVTATVAYVAALKAQVLWAKKDVAIMAIKRVAIKLQAKLTRQQTTATIGATAAQKGLNAAMAANIFAAIATVIIMAVQALVKWNKNLVKARINTKELNENIQKESQETDSLFEVLKKTNPESKEYQAAKEKLNQLYPTLLKHYDLENGSLEEIEAAQKAANNEVLRSISLKQKQADIQDVAEKANKKFAKSTERILRLAKDSATKGALASIMGDVSAQVKSGSISVEEGGKKIAAFLGIPEKYGYQSNDQYLMILRNLENIRKQSSKLDKATNEIEIFYTALTGGKFDFKSAFEFIDTAKTTEDLNVFLASNKKAIEEEAKTLKLSEKQTEEYLKSTYGKIKSAAEERKVLIEELNVAKPVIDEAKSESELEDYLKSTNGLVKKYAEQRLAQLKLGDKETSDLSEANYKKELLNLKRQRLEQNESIEWYNDRAAKLELAYLNEKRKLMLAQGEDTLSIDDKILDLRLKAQEKANEKLQKLQKAQGKIKILEPLKVDDFIEMPDEDFKFEEPDMSEASDAYDAFWNEQILKAKENIGIFSSNAKEREKAEAELAEKILQIQKTKLEEELKNDNLSASQRIELKTRLFDTEQQLFNQYLSNIDALSIDSLKNEANRLNAELENFKGTAEEKEAILRKLAAVEQEIDEETVSKKEAILQQSLSLIQDSFSAISGIYDAQQARVDAVYEAEVAATEEGSAERIAAEERYDNESRKIARKQAVLERAQGLFNVGISTAEGIMNAYSSFDPITATIFAAIIAGIGAAQAAAILATPLPAYEKGGTVLEDTLARVSERGSELAILPSGEMFMTPDTETIMPLQKGTEVIPNDQVSRYLARQAYSSANVEMGKTNRILEQIRDNEPDVIENGNRYTNKKRIRGKYKLC